MVHRDYICRIREQGVCDTGRCRAGIAGTARSRTGKDSCLPIQSEAPGQPVRGQSSTATVEALLGKPLDVLIAEAALWSALFPLAFSTILPMKKPALFVVAALGCTFAMAQMPVPLQGNDATVDPAQWKIAAPIMQAALERRQQISPDDPALRLLLSSQWELVSPKGFAVFGLPSS